MRELKLEVGEQVVYCPQVDINVRWRGIEGIIIGRCTSTRRDGTIRVRSILVRWSRGRKGVSCFRISGGSRRKSDSFKGMETLSISDSNFQWRFEESIKDLCGTSYCHECAYRLQRLVGTCKFIKK